VKPNKPLIIKKDFIKKDEANVLRRINKLIGKTH
jgi:hypothetical protein